MRDRYVMAVHTIAELNAAAADKDVVARLRLGNIAIWRHAMRQPDISADDRAFADRHTA